MLITIDSLTIFLIIKLIQYIQYYLFFSHLLHSWFIGYHTFVNQFQFNQNKYLSLRFDHNNAGVYISNIICWSQCIFLLTPIRERRFSVYRAGSTQTIILLFTKRYRNYKWTILRMDCGNFITLALLISFVGKLCTQLYLLKLLKTLVILKFYPGKRFILNEPKNTLSNINIH